MYNRVWNTQNLAECDMKDEICGMDYGEWGMTSETHNRRME